MATFSGVRGSIRGPDSQRMSKGLWNKSGLGIKEHEPGQAYAVAETPTKGYLDCWMGHSMPQVAQEAEKGYIMGV